MNTSFFRQASTAKISAPEELNDYIRVSNPSVWLILIGILCLLAGVLVWGVTGALPTTIQANGMGEDGRLVCYLSAEDAAKVSPGMTVSLNGNETGTVTAVDTVPRSSREIGEELDSDFLAQSLQLGDWNIAVDIQPDTEVADGRVYQLSITTQSTRPIDFLIN